MGAISARYFAITVRPADTSIDYERFTPNAIAGIAAGSG